MTERELIAAHISAFNSHNSTAWAERYAPNAVIHDPQYPQPLCGRAAIQKDIEDFYTAFPDIRFTVTTSIGSEGVGALEGTATGTHRGPMESPGGTVPATNKSMTMAFAAFVRIDDSGQITEERRYYDVAGMMQQLGLMQATT
jgi:steroid delta-isomerase-like uncharacterized protein